jgi:hypothetical protein
MPSRSRPLAVFAFIGLFAIPVLPAFGGLRSGSDVIVPAEDVVAEDLYALGGRTIVEGIVEGDLVVLGGSLLVTGQVDGDVIGLVGGVARIEGTVRGSVRLVAIRLEVSGTVGGDVSSVAGDAAVGGGVARDVLMVAGTTRVTGEVGRDLLTQSWRLAVEGRVGRDVVARVDDLTLGSAARVGNDLSYQASDQVRISAGAQVLGKALRRPVTTPVWTAAVVRAVGWLSVLGFIVGGILFLWLFRRTGPRAVGIARERPGKAALVGLGLLVIPPLVATPLLLTLVGLPVAMILLICWMAAVFMGPIPAVAAAGGHLLRGRGGLFGAFVVGALAWRASMWLLSLVAALLYVAALAVGLGSFGMAAWEGRRGNPALTAPGGTPPAVG